MRVHLSLCLTAFLSSSIILRFSQDASPFVFTSFFNFTHVLLRRQEKTVLFQVFDSIQAGASPLVF